MKLLCIETLTVKGCSEPDFIKGKIYETVSCNQATFNEIVLINDHGQEHFFDDEGEETYRYWFTENLNNEDAEKQIEIKTFNTENFKVEKTKKYNFKTHVDEPLYYITNVINDGTTFVTSETIDELISVLKYLKSL